MRRVFSHEGCEPRREDHTYHLLPLTHILPAPAPRVQTEAVLTAASPEMIRRGIGREREGGGRER